MPSRVIDIQSANERPDTLHKFANRVYTSRRSSVGSQESNMFDSCDRYDDRLANLCKLSGRSLAHCSHGVVSMVLTARVDFTKYYYYFFIIYYLFISLLFIYLSFIYYLFIIYLIFIY